MPANHLALIALNKINRLGAVSIHRLIEAFDEPLNVFKADENSLISIPYINEQHIKSIKTINWQKIATDELERSVANKCMIITLGDKQYPGLLKTIEYPPPVLYIRGELKTCDEKALAVVGSRCPTLYGKQTANAFVKELIINHFTIVSGLAYGIDAAAHEAALNAGGRTIAVVAHGLDSIYPVAHRALSERIAGSGAIVSEFPFGIAAQAYNFPRRNRLISGLAKGVLVIEAKKRSGALITAKWAGEQGREVFAIPGPYYSGLSRGCHDLIKDGAKLVTSIEDIVEECCVIKSIEDLSVNYKKNDFDEQEKAIVEILREEGKHIDQLSELLKQPVNELFSNLLTLEMKGVIISQPGQQYQLKLGY